MAARRRESTTDLEPRSPRRYVPRRPARAEMLALRGGQIALTRWDPLGSPAGPAPPVVLLHGWMDCGASFQFLADCLPGHWPLAAIDWRGYGRSPPREGYWLPEYFADLEAVLEQLSPDAPARLIGHSLGGIVASMYAGVRPRRLAWVVNIEGFGLWRGLDRAVPDRLAAWLDAERTRPAPVRYGSLEQLAARIRKRNPRLPAARARFLADVWSVECDGQRELAADPRHRRVLPLRFRNLDVQACWRRIVCPVLILRGEHSEFLARAGGPRAIDRWHRRIGDLRVAAIGAAGHMLHLEQPEQAAAEIADFVDARAGAAAGPVRAPAGERS